MRGFTSRYRLQSHLYLMRNLKVLLNRRLEIYRDAQGVLMNLDKDLYWIFFCCRLP